MTKKKQSAEAAVREIRRRTAGQTAPAIRAALDELQAARCAGLRAHRRSARIVDAVNRDRAGAG